MISTARRRSATLAGEPPEVPAVRVVTSVLLAVLVAGCGKPAPARPGLSLGGPSGSSLWVDGANPKAVPGLDAGACYYKGKLLLFWADDVASSGGGGSESSGEVRGDGQFVTTAGRTVGFKYHITGEKTGAVVIDGVEYDLARGNVFLVKTGGARAVVRQIDKDLSGVNLDTPDFRVIGRSDPKIAEFFQPPR
jgi:hypothetical protein